MKIKQMLILFALFICASAYAETMLTVSKLTEKEKSYALSNIGHLTFDSKKMYLWDKSGNLLGDTKFKNIEKVTFTNGNTDPTPNPDPDPDPNPDPNPDPDPDPNPDPNPNPDPTPNSLVEVEDGNVLIYPNPTQEIINIQGIANQTVRLFTLEGKLLITEQPQQNNAQININGLSSGVYLLQVGAELYKIIKQ